MCGAPWMMALTAIQGINQYNQQKQQYNAQSALYNAQAKAAEQNARISQVKQEQIAEQYAAQQSKLNDRMKLTAGQTAAQAGASGLQLSGSPLDALSSSYDAWRDDSSTLLQNQRNDVWSEHVNEVNYQNQANAYRTSAVNLQAQKKSALWGTILGTAASMYGIHRTYGAADKTSGTYNGAYDINPGTYYNAAATIPIRTGSNRKPAFSHRPTRIRELHQSTWIRRLPNTIPNRVSVRSISKNTTRRKSCRSRAIIRPWIRIPSWQCPGSKRLQCLWGQCVRR